MIRGTALLLAALSVAGPAAGADFFNGKEIYERHCEDCHGSQGRGLSAGTPDFTRGDGLLKSDLALFEIIANDSDSMHGFKHLLTNDEILDVISYLRGFET